MKVGSHTGEGEFVVRVVLSKITNLGKEWERFGIGEVKRHDEPIVERFVRDGVPHVQHSGSESMEACPVCLHE